MLPFAPRSSSSDAEELTHPLLDSDAQYILAHPAIAATAREALKLAGISEMRGDQPRIWLLDDGDNMAAAPGTGGEKDIRTLLTEEKMEPIEVRNAKERTALVCYSSGTSGKPKGVELTQ